MRYEFGGLILGGAYTWRGLFTEFYGNSYTRYPRKFFSQIYRALYGDAMLELLRISSDIMDGNQQKHLLPSFATKAEFTPRGTHKH